jgi:hypothetical protein
MKCFFLFRKKNKIKPITDDYKKHETVYAEPIFTEPVYAKRFFVSTLFNSKSSENIVDLTNPTYYRLTQNVRNMQKLSKEEKLFLSNVSRQNLLDIIHIYDNHSENIEIIINESYKMMQKNIKKG